MIQSEIEQALRGDVIPWLQANYPGFDLFVDNGPEVDFQSQVNPFVHISINWTNARQGSLGPGAFVQQYGDWVFAIFVKAGTGTAEINGLLDALDKRYRLHTVGGVRVETGKPYKAATVAQWYGRALRFPFEADDV